MLQSSTLIGQGSLGNSQAQNTVVATINIPTPGRYKVWGTGRHTLADGLKISSPIAVVISGGPNDTVNIGPITFDNPNASNIVVQLNVATGAADTASVTLYAENLIKP